ncbi:hypothetical protein ACMS1Z_06805 [Acidiphilium multivorum]|uniref:hypothetical protein n=1 Tax=Acidiphilium multivorum TaxID=62140 RepID=UPI0039C96FB6
MNRISSEIITEPAADANPATLGALQALLSRQAAELRAVAPSPLLRALVARMAAQNIIRDMAGVRP